MKIKLDENVTTSLCNILKSFGCETDTVYEEGLQGNTDDVVFDRAHSEGRIFITCDLDFADIRRFPPGSAGGIVVLRLSNRSSKSVCERMNEALKHITLSDLHGATTIVSDSRLRMRR